MTAEERAFVYALQGRLLACERLIEVLLMGQAVQLYGTDPVKGLDDTEKAMVRNIQRKDYHAEAPDAPFEDIDAILEAQGESLRVMFSNVRDKLKSALGRP